MCIRDSLKRKLGGEYFAPITLADVAFTDGVCKAGTPITAGGVKARTTGTTNATTDAVGILLNDVFAENPNGSLIKAFAVVNATVGATHSGVTYDDALKSALSHIIFE